MTDLPSRARSASRIAGDDYQHLVTWCEVLLALRPDSGVTSMTVEAADAGNVDDIVIERQAAAGRFIQVKHAVDIETPVGTGWLADTSRSKRSLLARFHESWRSLRAEGLDPAMQLVTDREIDPADSIMQSLDRQTNLLTPAIEFDSRAETARGRALWASHLGIDEAELIAMLAHLQFITGRPHVAEQERATNLMWGHGLVCDQPSLENGIAFVREWVQERRRTMSIEQLRAEVATRIKRAEEPGALLVIDAIDHDPRGGDSTELLDWVDLYEGPDANSRRQLRNPADWESTIHPELLTAAERLRAAGTKRVIVRGAMRLPLWFATGSALRDVRGFKIAAVQRGEIWASDSGTGAALPPATSLHQIDQGPDLAVAIGIATDPSAGVIRYINDQQLPVSQFAAMIPPDGPGPESVRDGMMAARLAIGLRDSVRALLEEKPVERLHLFIAAPGGLALLLGHRWNAMRPTLIYEHLGPGIGYAPTMTVRA